MRKHDVISNTGSTYLHNIHVLQRRQRRTDPRPEMTCIILVKRGRVVLEIYSRTDRHRDKQTDTLITIPRSSHTGGAVTNPQRIEVAELERESKRCSLAATMRSERAGSGDDNSDIGRESGAERSKDRRVTELAIRSRCCGRMRRVVPVADAAEDRLIPLIAR